MKPAQATEGAPDGNVLEPPFLDPDTDGFGRDAEVIPDLFRGQVSHLVRVVSVRHVALVRKVRVQGND